MAVDTDYSLAMSNGIASVAPSDTTAPTGMSALAAPWVDLGAMSTDGLSESLKQTRTDFKRWGSISIYKSVITDEAHTFKVTFLESNPNVLGLFYRTGTTPTPSGAGTSAVQTVTISGAPTGGTFTLTFSGQTTSALAYNATTAAVQTALQALSNIGSGNVTVTGTAGSSYVVTFAGALANSPQPTMTAAGSFTGGTSPAIAVASTTTGVTGNIISIIDDTTGTIDRRAFVFDLLEGTNHARFYCPRVEVTDVDDPVYATDKLTQYGVTLTAYPDDTGVVVARQFLLDAVVNG